MNSTNLTPKVTGLRPVSNFSFWRLSVLSILLAGAVLGVHFFTAEPDAGLANGAVAIEARRGAEEGNKGGADRLNGDGGIDHFELGGGAKGVGGYRTPFGASESEWRLKTEGRWEVVPILEEGHTDASEASNSAVASEDLVDRGVADKEEFGRWVRDVDSLPGVGDLRGVLSPDPFAMADGGVLGVGNLVFFDRNGNGVADLHEGLDGVEVQLFLDGGGLLGVQVTSGGGRYLFSNLPAGNYYVHIPASQFAVGRGLGGARALASVSAGDDQAGQDGLATPNPMVDGVSSAVFELSEGQEPVDAGTELGMFAASDNAADANVDLTVDFGFRAVDPSGSVGVGNLVYLDTNGSGLPDPGEVVDGVRVQIFSHGASVASTPLAEQTTANGGLFHFQGLAAGMYFLHIPLSEFAAGKPLFGAFSLSGAGLDDGQDDSNGENGLDTINAGISSIPFLLLPGGEAVEASGEIGIGAAIDNANDANVDLTIDFGFFGPGVSVGNLVFVDANGNGKADANEGVPGVAVQAFYPGADMENELPLLEAFTDQNGFYLVPGLAPGAYVFHVPAYHFQAGGALEGKVSLPGAGVGDDDTSEDGVGTNPTVLGVSTGTLNLVAGAAPTNATGETGLGHAADDVNDGATDLTVDFGFSPAARPTDFAAWQAAHPLNGQNGATQNPDGDGMVNLGEFVFCFPPHSAVNGNPFWLRRVGNRLDAVVRRLSGLQGVTWTVEVRPDLTTGAWTAAAGLATQVTANQDGTENFVYLGVNEIAGVESKGYVRVRASLGADSVATLAWGWATREVSGTVTFSTPFSGGSVFIGQVDGNSVDRINVTTAVNGQYLAGLFGNQPHLAEITAGPGIGHTFWVNTALSDGETIAFVPDSRFTSLAPAPNELAGATVAVRRLLTLDEVLPPATLTAGGSPTDSDLLLPFNGAFGTRFVANLVNAFWLDPSAQDPFCGAQPVTPTEGFFLTLRQPRTLLLFGEARRNPTRIRLTSGLHLVGNPVPVTRSFAGQNLTEAAGFARFLDIANADLIHGWNGAGYDTYWHMGGSLGHWGKHSEPQVNLTASPVFQEFEAVFIKVQNPITAWAIPGF